MSVYLSVREANGVLTGKHAVATLTEDENRGEHHG